ncbi:MAG: MnmC family methyltransferase [Gemmatimonadales bacterium]
MCFWTAAACPAPGRDAPLLHHPGNRLRPGPELSGRLAGLAGGSATRRAAPLCLGGGAPGVCGGRVAQRRRLARTGRAGAHPGRQAGGGCSPACTGCMFEGGRVQLTLAVGDVQPMLRDLVATADAVFLDGFSPACNPVMWQPSTLKGVARHCARGARVATWTIAREVRDALAEAGFVVHKAPGLPPKRDCLQGRYDPAWTPKTRIDTQPTPPRALAGARRRMRWCSAPAWLARPWRRHWPCAARRCRFWMPPAPPQRVLRPCPWA